MRYLSLALSFLIATSFVACSSKKLFKPQNDNIKEVLAKKSDFIAYGNINPVLKINNKYILRDKSIEVSELEKKFNIENLLFLNKNIALFSTRNGFIIFDKKNSKKPKFVKTSSMPILGFVHKNLIAVVSLNNKLSIFDTKKNDFIFKRQEENVGTISRQIASIRKYDNTIVIPFLNSKLLFYDISKNKIANEYLISSLESFVNFTFLHSEGNFLLASTKDKLFSIYNKKPYIKNDFNPKRIVYFNNSIYVFDVSGYLYVLDKTLNIKHKTYFKNAVASSLSVYKNYIYITESNGHILVVDKDLQMKNIFYNKNLKKSSIFIAKDNIYFNNHSLKYPLL